MKQFTRTVPKFKSLIKASEDKSNSAKAKSLKEKNKELHQSFDDYMDEVKDIGVEHLALQKEMKDSVDAVSLKQLSKLKDKASKALDKAVSIGQKIKDNEKEYKTLVGKEIFEASVKSNKFKTLSSSLKDNPKANAALDKIADLEKEFKKLMVPYHAAEKVLYDVKTTLTDKQFKDAVKKAKELQDELIAIRKSINEKRNSFKEEFGTETFRVTSSNKSNSPEVDKLVDQAEKLQKEISVMEKPLFNGTSTKEIRKRVADKYSELSVLISKITKLLNEESGKLDNKISSLEKHVTKASIKPKRKYKQLINASLNQLAFAELCKNNPAKENQIKALELQIEGIRKQIETLNKQLDNKNLSKEQKDSIHDRLDTLKERRKYNSNKLTDLR